MSEHRDTSSDDELIARLRAAAGPEPTQDPFMSLPVAQEESVPGDESCPEVGARCNAPGRRPLAVSGYFDVQVTEPVACELRAGHPGNHRACFTRSRVRHHWHAFGWADQSTAPH